MCVKETLPPRARLRWLLITVRLSIMSFAGIARTLVAVGTLSEASILCTTRLATPRSGSMRADVGVAISFAGCATGCAGVGDGCMTGRTVGWATGAGMVGACCAGVGCGTWSRLGMGGVLTFGAEPLGLGSDPFCAAKNAFQFSSTELGSLRNCSYISSTSHSLGPKEPPNLLSGVMLVTVPKPIWLALTSRFRYRCQSGEERHHCDGTE